MTPLLETLKQVREALDRLSKLGNEPYDGNSIGNQIAQLARNNLTALIAEIEKAEPVAWVIRTDNTNLHELDPNKTCSWLDFDVEQFKHNAARSLKIVDAAPLYTHPAPAIPEGWKGCGECDCEFPCYEGRTRCIRLAAAPEPKP